MGIVVQVIDAIGIEEARAPDHAVNLITLGEQKLGKVRAVLPGDAGDQRTVHYTQAYHRTWQTHYQKLHPVAAATRPKGLPVFPVMLQL